MKSHWCSLTSLMRTISLKVAVFLQQNHFLVADIIIIKSDNVRTAHYGNTDIGCNSLRTTAAKHCTGFSFYLNVICQHRHYFLGSTSRDRL